MESFALEQGLPRNATKIGLVELGLPRIDDIARGGGEWAEDKCEDVVRSGGCRATLILMEYV